jgi:hypothetical protein
LTIARTFAIIGEMPAFLRCLSALGAASFAAALVACGPSPIRVVGVMRESSEMRPLASVPPGAYQQLHVLVRAAPDQGAEKYGSSDCGIAPLEGSSTSQDRNNAACVPSETLNNAVRLVRQRLRAYGVSVAKDGSEPYDYRVDVLVTGVAPRAPDPMQAKAMARLTFTLRTDAGVGSLMGGIDQKAAGAAFGAVAKDCALRDAQLSAFSASATQPMTPDFDVVALASDATDNVLGCAELARFFLDVGKRYPKASSPVPPVAPAPSAPPAVDPGAGPR